MITAETLITFTLAALVMNLSPGPSFLYVMARSIAQGSRSGLAAVAGLASGSFIHAMAVALGLSAVFEYTPTLYTVLKVGGGFYLVYLGVQYFLTKPTAISASSHIQRRSNGRIFRESVLVELTNPKTILFYMAVLPQFVNYEGGQVAMQLAILGLIVTVSAIPCDLLVCFSAGKMANWLNRNGKARERLDKTAGTILVGLGTYVLLAEAD